MTPPRPDGTHPDPDLLDVGALQRRVLLTGLVSLVLLVAAGLALSATGAPPYAVLPVAVLVYAAVVRPMMRPVRAAVRLRRDLAFLAFQEQRSGGPTGRGRDEAAGRP